MEYITKSDLKKLAALCEDRQFADELICNDGGGCIKYSYLERCIAAKEAEWMKALSAKLLRIADSSAQRVEIIN